MTDRALAAARGRRLDRAVADAHILVCTGSGGVGKTTTAAALALAAAAAGRSTIVLTIDPARRLAQSLGIAELDNTPRPVVGAGPLWAMMLDMQTPFDEVVERQAASPERARAIRSTRIYRTLSSTLSGTQEYMAMEKLHELHERGEWDLLVIDTPPTRSALDFLDAPRRLTDFLEGRLLKILLGPGVAAGRGVGRMVGFGTQAFMRVAGRVTGMEVLDDLAGFLRSFEGMYDGFKQRADEVEHLLREPSSQFVVVATPQPPPLTEARYFLERLQQEGLHTAALVVNRVHPACTGCPPSEELLRAARRQDEDPQGRAVARVLELLADTRSLALRERRDVASALYGVTPPALVEVPLLTSDVHDLETLREVAAALV